MARIDVVGRPIVAGARAMNARPRVVKDSASLGAICRAFVAEAAASSVAALRRSKASARVE